MRNWGCRHLYYVERQTVSLVVAKRFGSVVHDLWRVCAQASSARQSPAEACDGGCGGVG